MISADIAIVVVTYNRPKSLQRLLKSLSSANYSGNHSINLIISVEGYASEECTFIAEKFKWGHGTLKVLRNTSKLGLKKHILKCGDLSANHDAIILLEDDIVVSPQFYQYAQSAYDFYKNDDRIAGIALYRPVFNEVACTPFEPIDDGNDVFFMQVPCSWGQLFTRKHWFNFTDYYNSRYDSSHSHSLPEAVQLWPDDESWKKTYYSYLTNSHLYFVYPRSGLSTNFGDSGVNITEMKTVFQSSLLVNEKKFRFVTLEKSFSIYDAFFEIEGAVYSKLLNNDLSVSFDLNGTKKSVNINTEYLISCRKCKNVIEKYSISCYPYELNILLAINTSDDLKYFSLGRTETFEEKMQFNRLQADLKRIFMYENIIQLHAKKEMNGSLEFKIGTIFLRPFIFMSNLLKSINKR
jgi:glycosyltransferase involved in cell wall biosynthesis